MISIEAIRYPLGQVLASFAQQAGFDIDLIADRGSQLEVSVWLEEEPAEAALNYILRTFSNTVVWDLKNKRIVVAIYGEGFIPPEGPGAGRPRMQERSRVLGEAEGLDPVERMRRAVTFTQPQTPALRARPRERDGNQPFAVSGSRVRFSQRTPTVPDRD